MERIDSLVGKKTQSSAGKVHRYVMEVLDEAGFTTRVGLSFLITLLVSASHCVGVVMELSGWEPPWPD